MELQVFLLFTSLLFLLSIVKLCRSPTQNSTAKLPPGPWKLPLVGHLHHLHGLLPHHALRNLAKKHGPLMYLKFGEVPILIVSSARLAQEVLKTHDPLFADRPMILASKIMTYDGIDVAFSPYGRYWSQMRKICILELLSAKRVHTFWSITREEEVANLVEDISSMAGSPVNMSEKIYGLMNDITCRAAFGKKYKEKEEYLRLIHEMVELGGGFDFPDLFPSLTFLHGISGMKTKLEEILQKIDRILQATIDEHRVLRRMRNKGNKDKMEEDLVDVLVRVQEDNELEFPLEDSNIKAVIMDMFVAGTDTSSTALLWAMSEIIRNPKVLEKAQYEVRHLFKGKSHVSQSDINELDYLKLVMKETLRLHPSLPLLLPRLSREKCEIDGYEIPKETRVIVNAWAIGKDPKCWGDIDAETFKPERFKDILVDYKGVNFELIPFGAGKRICPGMSFGISNIEFSLAQLLYHFDWKVPNGINPEDLDMTEHIGVAAGRKYNLFLLPTPCLPM